MTPLFEFPAQLEVIVNFTIEDDYGVAVVVCIPRDDGLISALDIDNLPAAPHPAKRPRTQRRLAGSDHDGREWQPRSEYAPALRRGVHA